MGTQIIVAMNDEREKGVGKSVGMVHIDFNISEKGEGQPHMKVVMDERERERERERGG